MVTGVSPQTEQITACRSEVQDLQPLTVEPITFDPGGTEPVLSEAAAVILARFLRRAIADGVTAQCDTGR